MTLPSTPAGHATPEDAVLDNVIWWALGGPHAALAIGDGIARRYPPEVAPFCAVRQPDPASLAGLAAQIGAGESAALVTAEEIPCIEGLVPVTRAGLVQMVLADPAPLAAVAAVPAQALSVEDVPDMLALVSATRPGPFGRRTIELGHYIGIRIGGELVAMGGERMKVPGFTEVSAVCVAAPYRGRGYAGGIIRQLAASIRARGETPFLHVVRENTSAIALYERLGFCRRRAFHLGVFKAP